MSFTFLAISGSLKGKIIVVDRNDKEIAEAILKNRITKKFPNIDFDSKDWELVGEIEECIKNKYRLEDTEVPYGWEEV